MILLKNANKQDIPVLLELEKSVSGTKIYSPMLTEEEWKEELLKNKVFLIEKDNIIVGNISYENKPDNSIYLSGLVVNPHFQRQGVARSALVQLLNKLKDVSRVELVTHPENSSALALYQSLGFIVKDRRENYYGDGEPRLLLFLKK